MTVAAGTHGRAATRRDAPAIGWPVSAALGRSPWTLAWLALVPIAIVRAGTLTESDTFWQIRAGLEILRQGRIPTVDTFSWTAYGSPWTLNSWGFDLALGLIHRIGGLPAVALAGAALVLLVLGLALGLARSLGAAAGPAGAVLWGAAVLLVGWFSIRPQLVDYAATLALVLLLRALLAARRPSLVLVGIAALTVVWVNAHAAALFEVGVLGAASALAALAPSARRRSRRLLLALGVGAVACLLNPYGAGVFTQTATVRSASSGLIAEWQHVDPANAGQLLLLALGAAALLLALRRSEPVLAAALLVAGAGGVTAIRLLPVLALLAAPMIAAACSTASALGYLRSRRRLVTAAAAAASLAMLLLAAPALTHLGHPEPSLYPGRAVTSAIPSGCRLFNGYEQGGYLVLERPDVRVSVDSRNDLYGADAVLSDVRAVASADPGVVPAEAGCAVLPARAPLAAALRADPAWRPLGHDLAAVLLVRR
ncbi:hypothetical protein QDR37_10550 [Amnibacterium sp. CER49]|uniref:hypothetical protein n=1 Tax=Amnibacterium sp. CER49 TaxID=3039161 RepID=UPI00244B6FFA|nr:hypothetical protein [Amnibacterium sp. CER49]MDH2444382.1 hypothetical protein [Amnibacterium sp. CER49]